MASFMLVYMYFLYTFFFFADVAGEGVEKGRPPRPLRPVSGQKERVASVLIYLVWASP